MAKFLGSKKTKAFLTGLSVLVLVHFVGLEEEVAMKVADQVIALTMVYLGAQGIADHGKGKAEAVAAASAPKPADTDSPDEPI